MNNVSTGNEQLVCAHSSIDVFVVLGPKGLHLRLSTGKVLCCTVCKRDWIGLNPSAPFLLFESITGIQTSIAAPKKSLSQEETDVVQEV